MKKKFTGLLIILIYMFLIPNVWAKSYDINVYTYYMSNYDEPYCWKCGQDRNGATGNCGTVGTRGCFAVTLASILKSYGMDYDPNQVGNFLCQRSGYDSEVGQVQYSNVLLSPALANEYGISVRKLPSNTFEELDEALENGEMVLISVENKNRNNKNLPSTTIFTQNGHYIAIGAKNDNGEYYVINTSHGSDQPGYSTWYGMYDEYGVKEQILDNVNAGMWAIKPDDLTSGTVVSVDNNIYNSGGTAVTPGSSSGSSGGTGSTSDRYPNPYDYFPELTVGEVGCSTLFLHRDGSLNEFGEFVQGVFLAIKVITPILVIAFSTGEYVKAILATNADDIKKANKRTIERLIIGLLIFLLPYLLDLLFHLFGLYDISSCGIVS